MTTARANSASTARAAQAAETRLRLIDAAVEVFSDNNYDDVTAGDIAKKAGASHGLVFHYFGSKSGIFAEAMRAAADQLGELFTRQPDLSPSEQLRTSLGAHLRYLSTRQGLALRLALGGRGTNPAAWEVFEAGRWRVIAQVGRWFGLDTDNQALRMAMRSALGFIDEATIFWLNNDQPQSVDTMVEYLMSVSTYAVEAAAALDPTLDITAALSALKL